MNILAIDPGPTRSTVVQCELRRRKNILDEPIQIALAQELPNEEMIKACKGWQADHYVCEMVACYGMPVGAEVFQTCVWIGRITQALWDRQVFVPLNLLTRLQVKNAICHTARAKDANIRQALIDRFGQPGTKNQRGTLYGIKSHAWSALAVAVAFHDRHLAEFKGAAGSVLAATAGMADGHPPEFTPQING